MSCHQVSFNIKPSLFITCLYGCLVQPIKTSVGFMCSFKYCRIILLIFKYQDTYGQNTVENVFKTHKMPKKRKWNDKILTK